MDGALGLLVILAGGVGFFVLFYVVIRLIAMLPYEDKPGRGGGGGDPWGCGGAVSVLIVGTVVVLGAVVTAVVASGALAGSVPL